MAAFISAVISGAAGAYVLTLIEDADVGTDLVVQPGQNVVISEDAGLSEAPSWGSGGFDVAQAGSLSLANVAVVGDIAVMANGTLQLHNVLWQGTTVAAASSAEGPFVQCFQPYQTLSDGWRSTATGHTTPGGSSMTDNPGSCGSSIDSYYQVTGVGGGRWYRFAGAGGDALPLTSPGPGHCSAGDTGWLSSWAQTDYPPASYSGVGVYPAAAQGVVEMTVCFDGFNDLNHHGQCYSHAAVGVVHCGSFLLWRLPDAPLCGVAYCTAPSGM